MLHAFFPKHADLLGEALANQEGRQLEYWNKMLLAKLIRAVRINASELEMSYCESPLSSVAFHARNLLELDIWIQYCGKSQENARRFLDDSCRDAIGLMKAESKSLSKFYASLFKEILDEADRKMTKIAKSLALREDDDNYTRVANAATEINKMDFFNPTNKILSKYAHPTAWSVLADFNEKVEAIYRMSVFSQGVLLAVGCVQNLQKALLNHGYKVNEEAMFIDFLANVWVSPLTMRHGMRGARKKRGKTAKTPLKDQ